MTRRRQFRELEVVATLLMQGAVIPCFRCRKALKIEDVKMGNVEKEHIHEIELGGPDEPTNCAFSHAAKPCHGTVTHGNGATFAGSSRHRIAKANDPERIAKFKVVKTALDADAVSEPLRRCPKCGDYPDGCTCPAPARRSAFGGRR